MDCKETANVQKTALPDGLAKNFSHMILTIYYKMQELPIDAPEMKLSSHAFHVLFILNETDSKMVSMTELVTRIRRTKQQLSKLISDLEDDGLVSRVRLKENRRTVHVVLTEKGVELIRQASLAMVQAMTHFLSGLPEEKLAAVTELTNQLGIFSN